ncbi:MAG: OB-fold domain-containing protein [Thermoplasmata archaeon]
MNGIVRAGAYAPAWGSGGRRVPGPDEDAFTLAATAVERAVGPSILPSSPVTVDVIGEAGEAASWGFGPLLGVEARVRSHPGGPAALGSALSSARAGPGSGLVVAVDLGSSGGPDHDSRGAGAVAFFLAAEAREDAEFGSPPAPLGPSETAVDLARRWFRDRSEAARASWIGDWRPNHRPLRPSPLVPGAAPAPPSPAVSEGAYLPRPRYVEGLPSRWRFAAERCGTCGRIGFPVRRRCRGCGRADSLELLHLPRDGGKVVALTWIGRGGQPTEFDPQVEATGPYGVVLVELAEGIRATLQLTDCDPGEVRIGDPVGSRLRRIYALEGEWRYGRKAVPMRETAPPPVA